MENQIKFKKNKIIFNKKIDINFTKEEGENLPFSKPVLQNALFEEIMLQFLQKLALSLIKTNTFKLTKPKIALCISKKNEVYFVLKKLLSKNSIFIKGNKQNFIKNIKEKLCTMGVWIEQTNSKIIFELFGANSMLLHPEQMSKIEYYLNNTL